MQFINSKLSRLKLLTIGSLIIYYLLGFHWLREDFYLFITQYSILFVFYFLILKEALKSDNFNTLLYFGLSIRILLLFNLPELSDDYFRYIWDGQWMQKGINPFDYKPSEIEISNAYLKNLYTNVNSPNYYSVYPGIIQFVNYLISFISNSNLLNFSFYYKILFLLVELFTWKYLYALLRNKENKDQLFFLFILNPLLLLDIFGNIHFEFLCIQFLILFCYWIQKKNIFKSALFISLAISTKIIPILILPFYFNTFQKRNRFFWIGILLVFLILFQIPFLNSFERWQHLKTSMDLYFNTFEFNSFIFHSTYSIIKIFNPQFQYADLNFYFKIIIVCLLLGIFFYRKLNNSKKVFFGFLIYFLFAAVLHPWYLGILIITGLLAGIYFPFYWSYLIGFSYLTYAEIPYHQPKSLMLIISLIVLVLMLLELFFKKNSGKLFFMDKRIH